MDLFAQTTITTTTTTSELSSGAVLTIILLTLPLMILAIAGMWKTYTKAGEPGWAAIVPIYNLYVLLKIAGREAWWLLLFFIPFANIVVSLIVSLDVAKKFGKSDAFGIFGLWLFNVIGYLILGFGDAQYQGANKTEAPAA